MGTRHLILVYYKGGWHIAQYGQLDGYPTGQGIEILAFVANPENITKLKAVLDTGNTLYEPTQEQQDAWDEERFTAWRNYSLRSLPGYTYDRPERVQPGRPPGYYVCPSTHTHASAGILDIVANATEPVPIVKSLDFLSSLLFCEWAYVVDLDEGALEVYTSDRMPKGRLKSGHQTRFVADENFTEKEFPDLVGKWMLDDLPSERDFLRWFGMKKWNDTDED